jgi:hypothetical protein
MSILFDNNASGTLSVEAAGDTPGPEDTTIDLQSNEGQLFPPVTTASGDFFMVTLESVTGDIEICKCTDVSTDQLTVARAQENTTSQTFAVGSKVELRTTAGSFDEFILRTGATMTGTLNMNGEEITDPVLRNTGSGELLGFALQGTDGGDANKIVVPSGAGDPTLGTDLIATREWANVTFVLPSRTLIAGIGIEDTLGDLSADRTFNIDFTDFALKQGAAILGDDTFPMYDTTAGEYKNIEYRQMGIPIVTVSGQTITPDSDNTNVMFVCTHSAAPIDFVLDDDIGEVGNFIIIQQADVQKVTVSGTATINCVVPNQRTVAQWSVIVLVCTSDVTVHQWALYGDVE